MRETIKIGKDTGVERANVERVERETEAEDFFEAHMGFADAVLFYAFGEERAEDGGFDEETESESSGNKEPGISLREIIDEMMESENAHRAVMHLLTNSRDAIENPKAAAAMKEMLNNEVIDGLREKLKKAA